MKRTKVCRTPVEFHEVLHRFRNQAKKKGYDYSLTDIQMIMARKLKHFEFNADSNKFAEGEYARKKRRHK